MFSKPINPWWNVLAGAFCTFFTAGIILIYAISFFTTPISTHHEFGREVLSFSFTCFFIGVAVGLTMLGHLIYRWGIKIPSIAGLLVFGGAIAAIPLLPPNQYLFYLTFFIMGFFGAAAGPVPASIAVTGWFDARRGLALGLMAGGGGLGGTFLPHYAHYLLDHNDWGTALVLLGLTVSIIPIVCLVLWVRTPPGVTKQGAESRTVQEPKTDQALFLRKKEFWILAFTVLSLTIGTIGVLANTVPILTDRGFSSQNAALLMSVVGISTLIGRLATGYILDKVFGPYVTCVICALCVIGIVLMLVGNTSIPVLILAAAFIGLSAGAEADVIVFLVSRYFSLDTYSRVVGIMWSMVAVAGGLGTYISGVFYEATGSYTEAFATFSFALLVTCIIVLRLGPYPYPAKTNV